MTITSKLVKKTNGNVLVELLIIVGLIFDLVLGLGN